MKQKSILKNTIITLLLSFLTIPFTYANSFDAITKPFNYIFEIGSFMWVKSPLHAAKFALFIIVFSLVFYILNTGIKGNPIFKQKKTASIISLATAAIATIFMPDPLAMGFGQTYSFIIALLLIGLPLGLLFWGVYEMTKDMSNIRVKHFIRLLFAIVAFSLVNGIASEYNLIIILPLLISEVKQWQD